MPGHAARPLCRLALVAIVAGALLPPTASATPFLVASARDQAIVNTISSAGSSTLLSQGSLMSNIEGVAIDAAGNVYVADSPNSPADKVVRIAPDGSQTTFASLAGLSPMGLKFDTAGNLFVSTQRSGSWGIRKITPDGTVSVFAGSSLLNRPFGIAFGASGDLFVASYGNKTIVRIDPAGTASLFASVPFNPFDVAFNTAGDLFVAYGGAQRVDRITPAGTQSIFFSGSPLSGDTMGLAIDTSDNVYVGTANRRIVRIAPDGGSATLFSTLGNVSESGGGLQYLALGSPAVPVPEPSIAVAAAAALVCLAARRLSKRMRTTASLPAG